MKQKEECKYKWLSLMSYVIAIIMLYYSFNEYASLYGAYKEHFPINNFNFHFNLVLSLQYFFLFLVVLFIGIITDKYGPGLCFFIQASLITLGQLLVCFSVSSKLFSLMYIGRILVTVGSSSIAISKGVFCRDYFQSTHLALTNSMTSMSFTLSQILNLGLVWKVYNLFGLVWCEVFALILNILGFILVFCIYQLDIYNNKQHSLYNYKPDYNNINEIQNYSADSNQNKQNNQSNASLIQSYIKDLSSLKTSYWFGSITSAISCMSLNSFIVLGPAILQSYIGMAPEKTSFYTSFLPYSTLIMPLIGKILDYYKSWFNNYYIISLLAFSGTLCLLLNAPIMAFSLIGLAYGTRQASEFPLISHLVDKSITGRAYSISRSLQNICFSLMLLMNSIITQQTGSYLYILFILLFFSFSMAISISIVKYYYSKEQQPLLSQTKQDVQQEQKIYVSKL